MIDSLETKTKTFLDALGRQTKIEVWTNTCTLASPTWNQIVTTTQSTYDDNGNRLTQTTTRTLANWVTIINVSGQAKDFAWSQTSSIYQSGANRVTVAPNNSITVSAQPYLLVFNVGDCCTAMNSILVPSTFSGTFTYGSGYTLTVGPIPETTVTTFTYDEANKPLSSAATVQIGVNPAVAVASTAPITVYDDAGLRKSETRMRKLNDGTTVTDVTIFDYDDNGKLNRTTYPDKTFDQSGFDPAGRLQATTNRAGQVTTNVFDEVNRQTATLFPDHTSITNVFDDAGQLIASIDARGFTTRYGYDEAGRRTGTTNALGQWTWNIYDAAGNLTSVTTLSGVTAYQYDSLSRRTNTVFADGTSQSTIYNDAGNRIAEIDQAGVITGFQYDGLGRLTAVTNAFNDPEQNQTITQYQYDEAGNLIQITDANGHITKFQFDTFGRKIKRTLHDNKFETFQYYDDNVGSLWKHTDFNLKTTTMEYDSNGRLMKKTPDSSFAAVPIQFTYTATGRRATMSDASTGTTPTKYEYLNNDRLWKKNSPSGTLTYGYDETGNVTNVLSSNPNVLSVTYQWDALGRLWKVTDVRTGGTTEYKYDTYGRLQEMDYPLATGWKHTYGYDELDRLNSVVVDHSGTTKGSFAYLLGLTGNRTNLTETLNGSSRTVNYAYDALYRLKKESIT